MGTLESQVRFANDTARVRSEIAVQNDRLAAVRASFKSALGLLPTDADPAWPHPALVATALPPEDELWRRIESSNSDLAQMRAMVDMALANVGVARTAGTPDFALGVMADLKADPLMIRPTASVSLPIWRGKIASLIAAAEARWDAAISRLNAEQLTMAAQLAQMLFMVRESDRMIAYIDGSALPNYERAMASEAAGYQSGMTGLAMIPETMLMSLGMQLERATALKDRETAVTGLLLMISDTAPAGSPLLAESHAAQP
jgi:outer membrane protein TolC